MQWLINNSQILIVLAFVGFSALGGITNWLQKQAAKNRAQAERRRMMEESLRTGRTQGAQAPAEARGPIAEPASEDDEESFAARRRRQLEELRRREEFARRQREAAAKQGSNQSAAPPTDARRPARPVPAKPAAAQLPPDLRDRMRNADAAEVTARAEESARNELGRTAIVAGAIRRAGEVHKMGHRGGMFAAGSLTRKELQRAIAMSEILAPPLALRDGSTPQH